MRPHQEEDRSLKRFGASSGCRPRNGERCSLASNIPRAVPITTAAWPVFAGVVGASPKKVTNYFQKSPCLVRLWEFGCSAEKVGRFFQRRADNSDVDAIGFEVAPIERRTRIAGWRLVRTHAAGAARALPRGTTSRPLCAPLLSCATSPDPEPLGAVASRRPNTGGSVNAVR
jgi:hypothetical protein